MSDTREEIQQEILDLKKFRLLPNVSYEYWHNKYLPRIRYLENQLRNDKNQRKEDR